MSTREYCSRVSSAFYNVPDTSSVIFPSVGMLRDAYDGGGKLADTVAAHKFGKRRATDARFPNMVDNTPDVTAGRTPEPVHARLFWFCVISAR